MTTDELKTVLELHRKWLYGESDGQRADLSEANLHGADLRAANLSKADLHGANLNWAYLHGANLHGADLHGTNLNGATLNWAYLLGANLSEANLRRAHLYGANLSEANLSKADLYGANLDWVGGNPIWPIFQIVPEQGAFIAYKRAKEIDSHRAAVLTLRIPASAKRTSSLVGRRCRASQAKVVKAEYLDGTPAQETVFFGSYNHFHWTLGKLHKSDSWDPDPKVECTHGLHFFITKQEACEYDG